MTATKRRKNSRAKGAGFERVVAKLLTDWWGATFHRTPNSGGLHWKNDTRVSGDIVAPQDGGEDFPFNVECKKVEGWTFEQILKGAGEFYKWWEQCSRDAGEHGKIPLLIFSKNRAPVYYALRDNDWLALRMRTDWAQKQINYVVVTVHYTETWGRVYIGNFDDLMALPKHQVSSAFGTKHS